MLSCIEERSLPKFEVLGHDRPENLGGKVFNKNNVIGYCFDLNIFFFRVFVLLGCVVKIEYS